MTLADGSCWFYEYDQLGQVIQFLEEAKLVRAVRMMPPETFEQSAKRIFDRHAELMDKLRR